MLVRDAFELVALLDEPGVLHLDAALLVHHLGDLVTHHLRHLLPDVILQHLQIVQFFIHLKKEDERFITG